ncbi:MAG: alpha/beta fold hydrolase [Acidimicrobiales bacterium]
MLKAFDGGRLFGSVHGSGPPRVLALHGWGRTAADFDAVLHGLDAVALDLPGFGATPTPPRAWGAADYAAAVAPVLDGADGTVVVIGHSFGARVAIHLAAARPGVVAGLVLTGAPLLRVGGGAARRPPPAYRLARLAHRRGLLGEARMESLRQRYGSADYRAATGVMRAVHVRAVNETYDEVLAALAVPVELVWGEDDADVPLAVAEALLGRLPGSTLRTVAGAGHLTPVTAPGALRASVDRLLAAHL